MAGISPLRVIHGAGVQPPDPEIREKMLRKRRIGYLRIPGCMMIGASFPWAFVGGVGSIMLAIGGTILFVIGHLCLRQWREYAVSRAERIYTVCEARNESDSNVMAMTREEFEELKELEFSKDRRGKFTLIQ